MDQKVRLMWLRELSLKLEKMHLGMEEVCPECAFYSDNNNYDREHSRNYYWGLCTEHVDLVLGLSGEIVEHYYSLERELGVYEPGLFRILPDGHDCSLRSLTWHQYLLKLVEA